MKLNNRYFAMRHGESKANVQELIISSIDSGIKEEYSLTEKGENSVRDIVSDAKNKKLLDESILIYSSPFSRCKKTAEIAKEILDAKNNIIIDDRLRERWFGNFEGTHHGGYQKVWDNDEGNKEPIEEEESAGSVKQRTVNLVEELEKKHSNKTFLLVSHGDVLQILETYFRNMQPNAHRNIKPLEKAEIRELK